MKLLVEIAYTRMFFFSINGGQESKTGPVWGLVQWEEGYKELL
jgi:hypothetical protein